MIERSSAAHPGNSASTATATVPAGSVRYYQVQYRNIHPVFCTPALERLRAAPIEKVIVTDTIPARPEAKVEVRSIAPLLGEAIRRIHGSESVSSLFA